MGHGFPKQVRMHAIRTVAYEACDVVSRPRLTRLRYDRRFEAETSVDQMVMHLPSADP